MKKRILLLALICACLLSGFAAAEAPEEPAEAAQEEQFEAPEYEELARGAKSSAVTRLQARLKELGYLEGSADGIFGEKTAAAMQAFQKANGLDQTGVATPEDQEKLFGGGVIAADGSVAEAYDPYPVCPVEVSRVDLHTSRGVDYVTFRVANTCSVAVNEITCTLYFYDADGELIALGDVTEHVFTCTDTIAPGKDQYVSTRDDENFTMEGASSVRMAVTRILLADGMYLKYDDPEWFEGT